MAAAVHPTPLHAARSLARRLGVHGTAGGHIRDRNGRWLAHGWSAWARIGVLTGVIRPVDGGWAATLPRATMAP